MDRTQASRYIDSLTPHLSYSAAVVRQDFEGSMENVSHPRPENWRQLYTTALFEPDTKNLPARIAAAQKAIMARERELFAQGVDTIEEDQALDDALYALKALQSCFALRAAAA